MKAFVDAEEAKATQNAHRAAILEGVGVLLEGLGALSVTTSPNASPGDPAAARAGLATVMASFAPPSYDN